MKEINGLIGICRKAGYVIIGGENIKKNTHKMYLILLDETAGNSLKREMNFVANSKNIPIQTLSNLANIVGIDNCKVIALKNKALSDKIIETLKGE